MSEIKYCEGEVEKGRYGAINGNSGIVMISVFASSREAAIKVITDELTRNPDNYSRLQAYEVWKKTGKLVETTMKDYS